MEKKLSKVMEEYSSKFRIDDLISGGSQATPQTREKEVEVSSPTVPSVPDKLNEDTAPDKLIRKTVSTKQRKSSLEEYQQTFLKVPKITDRKNVFISNPVREQIVEIVRRLGGEKTSVSGFIENLVLNHLELYREDIDSWKRL